MNKFTSAIEKSKIEIVPKTVISMGSGQGQGSSVNAFEMLLGLLISEKLGVKLNEGSKEENARVKSIKESIMKTIEQGTGADIETAEQVAPSKES
jgi:hypothetical protein